MDDEEFVVEMAEGMPGRLGYKVVGTTDSADALQTFTKDPSAFDLVITDQTMPQISGAGLAQKLKEIRPISRRFPAPGIAKQYPRRRQGPWH